MEKDLLIETLEALRRSTEDVTDELGHRADLIEEHVKGLRDIYWSVVSQRRAVDLVVETLEDLLSKLRAEDGQA